MALIDRVKETSKKKGLSLTGWIIEVTQYQGFDSYLEHYCSTE